MPSVSSRSSSKGATNVKRTGILGGSFDPPHNAHVAMARAALKEIPLDRVLFVPSLHPPHKDATQITPYETRVRLAELVVADEPGCEVARLEEFRDGPSYTVELLEHCRAEMDDDLYFLLGADSAADLVSWKDPERLLQLATLVLFPRTGFDSIIPVAGEASVIVFEEPVIDVSSSEVRDKVAAGESIAGSVPNSVQKFILDNSLYS